MRRANGSQHHQIQVSQHRQRRLGRLRRTYRGQLHQQVYTPTLAQLINRFGHKI